MKEKYIKYVSVAILSFANSLALCALKTKDPSQAFYLGVDSYGFSYESIFWFALAFLLLLRFFDRIKEKAIRRMIFSSVFGLLLAIATVWGTYIIYPEYSIFNSGKEVFIQVVLILGISLFSIPFANELFGWFDAKSSENLCKVSESRASQKKKIFYFLLVWMIIFACFLPLFLHFWPGSFGVDAGDQLKDYLTNSNSDHHPILHTLLLGWAYDLGVKWGNPSKGYQLYTIFQMLILTASFASFAEYLYEKQTRKWIRVVVILLFVLIPLNGYFAILSAKVTLAAAFMVFTLTFFLRFSDSFGRSWINAVFFMASAVLSCLFRNNAIYAFVVGGLVIIWLQKGIKKKMIFLLLLVGIILGSIGSKEILVASTGATKNVDNCRESLSFPIMCLVRTAVYHENEMPEEYLSAINAYVPKDAYTQYTPTIADSIKALANEDMLKKNKLEFLKLFIKVGFLFPGEYIEQFCFMTGGYWFTLDYPYCYGGSTSVNWQTIPLEVGQITSKDCFPIGGKLLDRLYIDTGRLSVPVFGFFFRGTIYTWFTLFAMLYGLYRKDRRRVEIAVIPFVYLLTVFLAPTSFIRYLYCNVATLPLMFWSLIDSKEG